MAKEESTMSDRFDALLLTIAAVALLAAIVIGAFDLVRGARERRAYDDYQRECQAFAKAQFPHGEVNPVAWCQP
jgi:hypothetical protein